MVLNRYIGLPHPEAIKAEKKVCLKCLRTSFMEHMVFLQLALFV